MFADILGDVLYDKTTCMSNVQYHPSTQQDELHYNLHSLYGWSQSEPSLDACRYRNIFDISRTFNFNKNQGV